MIRKSDFEMCSSREDLPDCKVSLQDLKRSGIRRERSVAEVEVLPPQLAGTILHKIESSFKQSFRKMEKTMKAAVVDHACDPTNQPCKIENVSNSSFF